MRQRCKESDRVRAGMRLSGAAVAGLLALAGPAMGAGPSQLRHPGPACERFVVEGGADEVVVQYTCRGRGYGRTHIRRETGRLVQIDSRGIANGLPFEFSAEARRTGNCGGV